MLAPQGGQDHAHDQLNGQEADQSHLGAAARYAPAPGPIIAHEDPQVQAEAAIGALWALFDTAYREANEALEAMGEPGRISVTRMVAQRAYRAAGPDGSIRTITVCVLLRAVHGQLCGGAFIGTNRSRLAIYLMPGEGPGQACWRVAATGQYFSDTLVHGLFLSVFGDDPAATLRLSPLSGHDIYQGIWS